MSYVSPEQDWLRDQIDIYRESAYVRRHPEMLEGEEVLPFVDCSVRDEDPAVVAKLHSGLADYLAAPGPKELPPIHPSLIGPLLAADYVTTRGVATDAQIDAAWERFRAAHPKEAGPVLECTFELVDDVSCPYCRFAAGQCRCLREIGPEPWEDPDRCRVCGVGISLGLASASDEALCEVCLGWSCFVLFGHSILKEAVKVLGGRNADS